jgi:hypothetical protein
MRNQFVIHFLSCTTLLMSFDRHINALLQLMVGWNHYLTLSYASCSAPYFVKDAYGAGRMHQNYRGSRKYHCLIVARTLIPHEAMVIGTSCSCGAILKDVFWQNLKCLRNRVFRCKIKFHDKNWWFYCDRCSWNLMKMVTRTIAQMRIVPTGMLALGIFTC